MMIIWALLFFSVLIAYNSGEIRGVYFIDICISFIIYLFTIHKIINKPFKRMGRKFNELLRFLSKKLKFSKKSFKNLLHFSK